MAGRSRLLTTSSSRSPFPRRSTTHATRRSWARRSNLAGSRSQEDARRVRASAAAGASGRARAGVSRYHIRLATPDDADAIVAFTNQGIEDRVATLETELRTPDERRRWMADRSPNHPVIVADVPAPADAAATVVGWAASRLQPSRRPTGSSPTSRSTSSAAGAARASDTRCSSGCHARP